MSKVIMNGSWGSTAASKIENPGTPAEVLEIKAEVMDTFLRKGIGDGFDGMEQVFAIVPTPEGDWKRHDLRFKYRDPSHNVLKGYRDYHVATLSPKEVDMAKVKAEGVAYGVSTNVGDFYLQDYGRNHIPYSANG